MSLKLASIQKDGKFKKQGIILCFFPVTKNHPSSSPVKPGELLGISPRSEKNIPLFPICSTPVKFKTRP